MFCGSCSADNIAAQALEHIHAKEVVLTGGDVSKTVEAFLKVRQFILKICNCLFYFKQPCLHSGISFCFLRLPCASTVFCRLSRTQLSQFLCCWSKFMRHCIQNGIQTSWQLIFVGLWCCLSRKILNITVCLRVVVGVRSLTVLFQRAAKKRKFQVIVVECAPQYHVSRFTCC